MENFTPLTAALGGILIGVATALLWIFNGRIAGISGIAGGIYPIRRDGLAWRLVFLAGLPLGAVAGNLVGPAVFAELTGAAPEVGLTTGWLVASAALVGVGTRLSGGCTSGHGICGLSRLSPRSAVAVGIFFAMAAGTVFIVRHVV